MQARVRDTEREMRALQEKARRSDPELEALLEHVTTYASRMIKNSSREALIVLLTRAVWRASR